MTSPEVELENLRERIEAGEEIAAEDQEALEDFDHALTLLNSNYSTHRHVKLLRHCTIMSERVGGLGDALTDREAAEELVKWINQNYTNEETNQDYRVALKVFGRRTTDEGVRNDPNEPPESLDWIPSGTSNGYDPTPEPKEMLGWHDDVIPMIEETNHERDAAAIAVAFDAGLRGFEFRDLTIGDITDHVHGFQVTVNGKQGRRTVTLIPSVPYLTDWLEEHPAPDDKDAPLWCGLEDPGEISYRMLCKMFKKPAERAGVDKPVTLTNFRKSSASYHASKGLNQAHLEDRYGWVRGSDAASRYVSTFGKDRDNELAKMHGIEVEEEDTDKIGPVPCPRCGELQKREAVECSKCHQVLRVEAAATLQETQSDVKKSFRETPPEDEETGDLIEEFDQALESDAEFREEVASLLAKRTG